MSPAGSAAYDHAVGSADLLCPLETWGNTTLGMVTGNHRFFTLSPAKVH